jgi:thiamine-monophosphate kinase
MLVAGRHFFADADPVKLGHKALAVNLSDLAAMGAKPRWALLSLALPEVDEAWLAGFSKGFFDLAAQCGVDLIGGDTTRGPLNISVTIMGEVATGRALRRDAARIGDDIWVSGELGGAALGLRHLRAEVVLEDAAACLARLHTPQARLELGLALVGVANAAIDLSDGLVGDLGHILERSGVGARLEMDAIPLMPVLRAYPSLLFECALAGGDDYELCFTAPTQRRMDVLAVGEAAGVAVTRIGTVEATPGLFLRDGEGRLVAVGARGYDHFA